jgi:hypothetical protein
MTPSVNFGVSSEFILKRFSYSYCLNCKA